jgi:hypothetical protein
LIARTFARTSNVDPVQGDYAHAGGRRPTSP